MDRERTAPIHDRAVSRARGLAAGRAYVSDLAYIVAALVFTLVGLDVSPFGASALELIGFGLASFAVGHALP